MRMDALLEAGRRVLLEAGYVQDSLRRFRLPEAAPTTTSEYSCQEDGMVGLGAGARSYTRDVHYSTDWAVGRGEVEAILRDFLARGPADFARADHGIRLTLDDRKRRFLIKSILKADGLDLPRYREVFGTDALQDFADLQVLRRLDLAVLDDDRLRLTARGMELSDGVGAWFVSPRVLDRMRELPPR
jgi:oxygen-independent coproporphyrinogen-3 oxidase